MSDAVPDIPFYYYEPGPPTDEEIQQAEAWQRVQREGALVVDSEGNVVARILAADT